MNPFFDTCGLIIVKLEGVNGIQPFVMEHTTKTCSENAVPLAWIVCGTIVIIALLVTMSLLAKKAMFYFHEKKVAEKNRNNQEEDRKNKQITEYQSREIEFIKEERLSINKIKNENTIIIAPQTMKDTIDKIEFKDYIYLNPNENIDIDNINIKTIPAYNIEKSFHPRKNNWLGYIVTFNNISYYIAGDTDKTKESESVKCDIALIPIGGYYTMDVEEATELIKIIKPKIVIPTHYGSIVGNIDAGKKLRNNLYGITNVIEKW